MAPCLRVLAAMRADLTESVRKVEKNSVNPYREKPIRDGIKKTPLGAVNLFGKLLTLVI